MFYLQVTKDIGSTKIWRKISMINGRRVNGDIDDIMSLKLQKVSEEQKIFLSKYRMQTSAFL